MRKRHKASAQFGDRSAEALDALTADIRDNGLRQKILVSVEGEIVDGWHRYLALEKLGRVTDACFETLSGDPVEAALASQLTRRNLTAEQLYGALLAAGYSQSLARGRSLVDVRKASRVDVIAQAPDAIAAFVRGEVSLRAAWARVSPPQETKKETLPDRSFLQGRRTRPPVMRPATPSAVSDGAAPVHMVIPDTQVKPGVPLVHFRWLARYAAERQPELIIHLGDHYDLPSLSSYDKGTRRAEGRRLSADIEAGRLALKIFNDELEAHAPAGYSPVKHMLTGNHEIRLQRHIDACPELDGQLTMQDLPREEFGWQVHDFLSPVDLNGVSYCHYFVRNAHGKVTQSKRGQASARAQVIREMKSCVAGHAQSLDVHYQSGPHGIKTGIIAGSCYLHDEEYLTEQGSGYWRGCLVLNNVVDGEFALWCIGLDWLCRRYEGVALSEFLASAKDSDLLIADV